MSIHLAAITTTHTQPTSAGWQREKGTFNYDTYLDRWMFFCLLSNLSLSDALFFCDCQIARVRFEGLRKHRWTDTHTQTALMGRGMFSGVSFAIAGRQNSHSKNWWIFFCRCCTENVICCFFFLISTVGIRCFVFSLCLKLFDFFFCFSRTHTRWFASLLLALARYIYIFCFHFCCYFLP